MLVSTDVPKPIDPSFGLAEMQGLYGAFSFSEKLLQKLWWRGDFDRAAATTLDGQPVRIAHPGKWNLLGGPDFTSARLRFGGEGAPDLVGDVELHLRSGDWDTHGHARDPAYDRVLLHVVLFPPEPGRVTRGAGGRVIPVLVLLPLLHRALEEFATDEAVESLADRPLARLPQELGPLSPAALVDLLQRHARTRWQQKVHFADVRLRRLGWEAALHHAALEILGFRFNRGAMLRIAGQCPLPAWCAGQVDPAEVFRSEQTSWSLQGVRPANHPRRRLGQYATWVQAVPDWPARVLALGASRLGIGLTESTRTARRASGLSAVRARVAREICADAIGGTRLDNLVCDGLLPLLAAQTANDFYGCWYHWFTGDLPPVVIGGLRQLGFFDGRDQPACHGAAQGLLGWLLEREPGP